MVGTEKHSSIPRGSWGVISYLATIGLLAAVYFVTGTLGLKVAFVNTSASAVWPPAGIALAAVLLLGYRVWPGIWLGAFLVNVVTVGWASIGIATGNTLEALLGGWLVSNFANGRRTFERASDIFKFILLAAIVGSSVSATCGLSSLAMNGSFPWASYFPVWLTWWMGDSVSIMVITPLIVIWSTPPYPEWNRRQTAEATLILVMLLVVCAFSFGGHFATPSSRYPRFLLVPVLMWAAYRFGQRGASGAIFLVTVFAVWGTLRGFGPFIAANANSSLLLVETFIATVTLTNLVLAAVVSERRRSEQALQDAKLRIGNILDNVSDAFWAVDRDWRFIHINAQAGEALRRLYRSREEILGRRLWDFPAIAISSLEPELRRAMRDQVEIIHEFHDAASDEWFEARIDPTPDGIAVFQRNISNRKRAEDVYRELFERERAAKASAEKAKAEAERELAERRAAEQALGRWASSPLPHESISPLWRYGAATVAVLSAILLRQACDPFLDDTLPLVTIYGAVAFAVWYGGIGPALFAVALGWLGADWFFLPPRYEFDLGLDGMAGLSLFLLSSLLVVSLGEAMRRAQRHAHQSARVAVERQHKVEAEMKERERAELALRGKEAELRGITEVTPIILARCSRDMRYRYVNKACAELFGRAPEQIIGKSIPEVMGAEAFQTILPHVEAVLKGQRVEYEAEIPYRDLGRHFMRVIYMPDHDEQGNVIGWVASITDITERKRAEEALRESEERFRVMADAAPVLVWIAGTDKRCTYFNKPWLEFTGRTLDQELGDGWAKGVHPDDLDHCLETYTRAFDARQEFKMEYRLRRHDGEYRWLVDHGVPRFISPNDGFDGYIGSCIDITERKRNEQALRENQERLARLINSAMDAVLTVDARQRIVLLNPAAEQMFGCPAREALGSPLDRFIPDDFREAHRGHVEKFGQTGVTGRRMGALGALTGLRANGEKFPIEASISHMEVGTEKLFTVILRDITERKRAEAELMAWQTELESRVGERTAELATAHKLLQAEIDERRRLEGEIARAIEREQLRLGQELHEGLGQHLAGIGFMLSALQGKLEKEASRSARDAQTLQKMIVQSVEQTRSLAKSFYPVELERHGLLMALQEVAYRTERLFGISCVVVTEDPICDKLNGPLAIQLFRIAQEAIHNTVKHARAKLVVIRLGTFNGNLTLTVKDDGVGFGPDAIASKGMGLRIMKYRARMAGATLDFGNDPGGGAIVTCSVVNEKWTAEASPEKAVARDGHVTAYDKVAS